MLFEAVARRPPQPNCSDTVHGYLSSESLKLSITTPVLSGTVSKIFISAYLHIFVIEFMAPDDFSGGV